MKGLLLKDLYYIKNNFKVVIIFAVIMGVLFIGQDNVIMGITMVSFMLTSTAVGTIAADDKGNWNKYALTMPISRKDIVVEKFLFVNSILIISYLICSVGSILFLNIGTAETYIVLVSIISVLVVLANLQIFISYKFGAEKTTVYVFTLFGLVFFFGYIINRYFPSLTNSMVNFFNAINIVYIGIATIVISILVSMLFYALTYNEVKNKEF